MDPSCVFEQEKSVKGCGDSSPTLFCCLDFSQKLEARLGCSVASDGFGKHSYGTNPVAKVLEVLIEHEFLVRFAVESNTNDSVLAALEVLVDTRSD